MNWYRRYGFIHQPFRTNLATSPAIEGQNSHLKLNSDLKSHNHHGEATNMLFSLSPHRVIFYF